MSVSHMVGILAEKLGLKERLEAKKARRLFSEAGRAQFAGCMERLELREVSS